MQAYKDYLEIKKLRTVEEYKLRLLRAKAKSLLPNETEELDRIKRQMRLQEAFVEKIKEETNKLNNEWQDICNSFNDIEGQVFYLRHIKGFSLKDIATQLERSYGYIRIINNRIKSFLKKYNNYI